MIRLEEYCDCSYATGTHCSHCGNYICSDCGKIVPEERAGSFYKKEKTFVLTLKELKDLIGTAFLRNDQWISDKLVSSVIEDWCESNDK
jgi:methionyl-tRNA synthetase